MPNNFLDHQLAQHIAPDNSAVQAIVMQLSSALSKGHTCIQIEPEQTQIIRDFGSPALVLEDELLYLKRYAQYEAQLATLLKTMAQRHDTKIFDESLLQNYFNDPFQAQAAQLALQKDLAIITGGPGTGKTTTVVKILGLLKQCDPSLAISLCAPTGKAAMRLQESISGSKTFLTEFSDEIIAQIPENVMTIHRLLGARPFTTAFRHNADNPLLSDVVVVDEASMIDLALMVKLVEALKPSTKLILLGDKDQLASVESGAVLADCYQALGQNRVELQNTYRFSGKIKTLAVAVNQQQESKALSVLKQSTTDDPIEWFNLENDALKAFAIKHYQPYFQQLQSYNSQLNANETKQWISNCFVRFNQFQILAATRQGDKGVITLNAMCESALQNHKNHQNPDRWYSGRPVMILRNDSNTQLFNGDIGLCLPSPKHQNKLRVFFPEGNGFRSFAPTRLPEHETAFAMTIHKSQGSEFEHVLIALPDILDEHNQLVTKELLYTAITRGKSRVSIQSNSAVLSDCINAKVSRVSGLQKKLTR